MSTAACPRCSTALGISRWCQGCGLDLLPYHAPAQAPAPAFLPPAGASAPVEARPLVTRRFGPLRTRSLLAVRWLWLMVALGLVALGIDVDWLAEKASSNWSFDDLISIGHLMDVAALVQLITYLIAAVIFLFWFHRAYANLRVLGVGSPRASNGWAIGVWFIPILNLYRPKQLADDIWRAGDPALRPGDPAWLSIPVAPLVHWWWALWLLGNGANVVAGNLITNADTMGAFEAAVIVDAVSQLLGLASCFTAMLLIKRATRRQELRASVMGLPGGRT